MIEHVFGLDGLTVQLREAVRTLDAASLTGPEAAGALARFAELGRLAAAGASLVAARAAETNQWRQSGDRSLEHWLARETGSTVGAARDALDTAARLRSQPVVEAAFRSGELSPTQASVIAEAGAPELVAVARETSVAELRRRAEAIKAATRSAEEEAARELAIHRSRALRRSVAPDGAHELHARGTAAQIARFWSRLQPFVDEQFARARAEERREPVDAYAFDALLAMSEAGGSSKPNAKVLVRVDLGALRRGTTAPGEVCEIAGFGPVPVSEALKLMPEAFLALVVTKGKDVVNVTHLGRQFTAHQQTALEWRDPECQVLGCPAAARLERDHRDEWNATHRTTIVSADRLCHHHHVLKTAGWRLEAGAGKRRLLPP